MQLDVKSEIACGPFHVLFHVIMLNGKSIFFFKYEEFNWPITQCFQPIVARYLTGACPL